MIVGRTELSFSNYFNYALNPSHPDLTEDSQCSAKKWTYGLSIATLGLFPLIVLIAKYCCNCCPLNERRMPNNVYIQPLPVNHHLAAPVVQLSPAPAIQSHIKEDISHLGFIKVSNSPEVYECSHFLSDDECAYLIEKGRPNLERSKTIGITSASAQIDRSRTSSGAFLTESREDETIKKVFRRIEAVTNIPQRNSEDLQVLHYGIGGEYQPHFDYFDRNTQGGAASYDLAGQRVATVLFYLNTPKAGGETIFPMANNLKIKPTKGKAVLFYNLNTRGNTDLNSLHGGMPVIAGEKWLATLWLRERELRK